MQITVMLVSVIIILMLFGSIGCSCGLMRSLLGLVSLVIGVFTIAVITVGVNSWRDKETEGIILSLIFIVVIGFLAKIVKWIFKALDSVAELPVLNILNKLGGLVIGLACGMIAVWVAILLVEKTGNEALLRVIREGIATDGVMQYIYDMNLVKKLILIR